NSNVPFTIAPQVRRPGEGLRLAALRAAFLPMKPIRARSRLPPVHPSAAGLARTFARRTLEKTRLLSLQFQGPAPPVRGARFRGKTRPSSFPEAAGRRRPQSTVL